MSASIEMASSKPFASAPKPFASTSAPRISSSTSAPRGSTSSRGSRPSTTTPRPATSASTRSAGAPIDRRVYEKEVQTEFKGWLMGERKGLMGKGASFSLKKDKKPKDQTTSSGPLSHRSDSSSSMGRSRSSKDVPPRAHTTQPTSRNVRSPTSILPTPDIQSPRSLSAMPSVMSIRSDKNDPPVPMKKKIGILGWKSKHTDEGLRSGTPQPVQPIIGTVAEVQEHLEKESVLDRAYEQLPATLTPAAAKLLGITGEEARKRSAAPTPIPGSGRVSRQAMSPAAMSPRPTSPAAMSPRPMSPVRARSPEARLPPAVLSVAAMSPAAMSPRPMSPAAMSPRPMSPAAMSPRPMSPAQSRSPAPRSGLNGMSNTASITSFATESTLRPGTVSPQAERSRPEHPLELEARVTASLRPTTSHAPAPDHPTVYFQTPPLPATSPPPQITTTITKPEIGVATTFLSFSSDEESTDEDGEPLRDSDYSFASSQTSYGVNLPADHESIGDGLRPLRKPGNAAQQSPRRIIVEDNSRPTTSHQQQASTSSFGSNRASGTSSPVPQNFSAPNFSRSFSRPFTISRPTSQVQVHEDFTNPRPAPPRPNDRPKPVMDRPKPIAIGLADGQPGHQLGPIWEDSMELSEDHDYSVFPTTNHVVGSRSHARQAFGSNTSRLRRPESERDPDLRSPTGTEITGRPSSEIIRPSSYRDFDPPSKLSKPEKAAPRSAMPLSLAIQNKPDAGISETAAQNIVLRILEAVDSFDDLLAGARLNKGFWIVYKRNELRLLKNALRNSSPPQWELREASPKEVLIAVDGGAAEYSPEGYVNHHNRDNMIIEKLKGMLLKSSFGQLRAETASLMREADPAKSARVDDAMARVWTFCTIFGADSRIELDIDAQVDWIRGGEDARRNTSVSSKDLSTKAASRARSRFSQLSHLSSESFGQGNLGGLSVEEMEDMTEIWLALKHLLAGLTNPGRIQQARAHGVFHGQSVAEGDLDAEQAMLEEWVYWLATQGLSVICDMAEHTSARRAIAFSVAEEMEWTRWSAPRAGTSRKDFLTAAIQRINDDRRATKAAFDKFSDMPASERRRSRGVELAAKLREKERGFNIDDTKFLWLAWSSEAEKKPRTSPSPQRRQQNLPDPAPPPQRPLPLPPSPAQQQRRQPLHPSQHPAMNGFPTSPHPDMRPRGSAASLSLFPQQYRPRGSSIAVGTTSTTSSARNTPTHSPMRSRQNSATVTRQNSVNSNRQNREVVVGSRSGSVGGVVRQAESIENLRRKAMVHARQSVVEEEDRVPLPSGMRMGMNGNGRTSPGPGSTAQTLLNGTGGQTHSYSPRLSVVGET